MSQHPDDRTQGELPDPEAGTLRPGDEQDLHPAIDHRESVQPSDSGDELGPPPLDIDERAEASGSHTAPDVIELSEHVDVAGEHNLPGAGLPVDSPVEPPAETADPGITGGSEPVLHTGDDATDADGDPASPEAQPDFIDDVEDPLGNVTTEAGGSVPPDGDPVDEPPPGSVSAKASSRFAGMASRLGFGKQPGTAGDAGDGRGEDPKSGPARSGSRLAEGIRSYLDPRLHMFSTIPHRRVMATGIVLALVSLLANSGGLALIVLSAIVPVLIVITLTQHDVFEKESNLLIAAVGVGGAIVGIVLSLLSAWIQWSQWFDTGVLNFGAAGFGGRFADEAGSAPFIVWFMVGLVVPVVALAGIAGIPIAMRRWPQFRNEVMDGMILTGASAAGFSIGASIVYWWPMIADPGPQTNVSDWTLSIIGVTILRTSVITLCGAMIGAGIWRYMITPAASVIVLPAVGGAIGYVLLTFGSIQFQAAGNWPELLWIALLLAVVFVVYRRVLDQAVMTDRRALGGDLGRLVCPSCHRVTPPGAFCARCGKPLHQGACETEEPIGAGTDSVSGEVDRGVQQ